MGLLRFLLAMAVMIDHGGRIGQLFLLPGRVAVALFFIISGYYMALTIEKHYVGRTMAFYANRVLRLFPMHIACTLIVVALFLWHHKMFLGYNHFGPFAIFDPAAGSIGLRMLFDWGNWFLLGADWISGTVSFHQGYQLNPPMWSIGTELSFYLVAPFVVMLRLRYLLSLCVLGALAWHYSIFPEHSFPNWSAFFVSGVVLYKSLRFAPTENKTDKFLGDLSYPLYVFHWPFLQFVLPVLHLYGYTIKPHWYGVWCILLTIPLYLLVDRSVQGVRARLRKGVVNGFDTSLNLRRRFSNLLPKVDTNRL